MWTFLTENKTKILGTATTVIATLLTMIALGMFDKTADDAALMSPHAVRWFTIVLSLLNVALGGGTIAAGVANTTNIRVAEAATAQAQAQSDTARQMAAAINAPPGTPVEVIQASAPPTGGKP